MLKDITTIKISYSKSRHDDIASEFYLPCLRNAIKYDRATGYFGSTIYFIAWSSLKKFVENGGRMRIICSPYLAEEDRHAIEEGFSKDNQDLVLKEFNDIFAKDELTAPEKVLACLIANGILQIRIAIGNEDPNRLFHDKIGVFYDGHNAISFRGSMNETFKGLSEDGNFESLDVFTSWKTNDDERCLEIMNEFDNIWNNKYDDPRAICLPDNIIETIKDRVAKGGFRWEEAIDETIAIINKDSKWCADKGKNGKKLRAHQSLALRNWDKNGRKGIFEHATGSGKTFTAMCAIRKCIEEGYRVLVVVPSVGLMYQWEKELKTTLSDIEIVYLLCGTGETKWKEQNALSLFTNISVEINCIIIAVADTAASSSFLSNISNPEKLLIVADEVHSLGSERRRNIFNLDAIFRLGLSATPYRYNDPIGTNAIMNYFGGVIEPKYTLEQAIHDWVLCRYFYYPHVAELNEEEQKLWDDLSNKINEKFALNSNKDGWSFSTDKYLQNLVIQRARILKGATAKIDIAYNIIKKEYKEGQRWIVYCDTQDQMDSVFNRLKPITTKVLKYHSNMSDENKSSNLQYFSEVGGIIISIRCLDEGIDIPKTSHALILASSQNPREYIQRRGRILRNSENKRIAYLHDVLVVPNNLNETDNCTKIVSTEISRAIQFASWANNKICIYNLQKIALDNGIDINEILNFGIEDE